MPVDCAFPKAVRGLAIKLNATSGTRYGPLVINKSVSGSQGTVTWDHDVGPCLGSPLQAHIAGLLHVVAY